MKQNQIITIGRQFGAKGRSIGKKIADELGIAFYDKELIVEAAKSAGISERLMGSFDEVSTSSLFYSLVMNAQDKKLFGNVKPVEQLAYEAQVASVKNVASQGACVIVGRAADCILEQDYDIFSIFISAPLKDRVIHVSKRDNVSEREAENKIMRLDKARASFYNGISNKKWGAAENYTLCFDSSTISEEFAIRWIIEYITQYWNLYEMP